MRRREIELGCIPVVVLATVDTAALIIPSLARATPLVVGLWRLVVSRVRALLVLGGSRALPDTAAIVARI